MSKYVIVIPARLNSTRLPNKPLIEISGIPMIIRTYLQCTKVVDKSKVYIATDSEQIINIAKKYNANAILTSKNLLTGTDRVAEVSNIIDSEYYINIQGDEPVFNPNDIKLLIDYVNNNSFDVVAGYTEIKDKLSYKSNSVPKLCVDLNENLLYMSRSSVPGNKSGKFIKSWKQICAYAFTKNALSKFSEFGKKTPLEAIEDIEILRFLELGIRVKMLKMSSQSIPVDHPSDIKLVENFLENAVK